MAIARRSVTVAPRTQRNTRNPVHPFNIRARPFSIVPFLLAPVLPGETMKSLLLQSRVVSKPVADPLIGWWHENYFFYVKHRDLHERDDLTEMMLDFNWDGSSLEAAADPDFYHGHGIPWLKMCYVRIVEEYFRAEGEAWDYATDALGYALAYINQRDFLDSAIVTADRTADLDVTVSTAGDDAFSVSEIQAAYAQWEFLRANQYTQMDYEDYLASYGVRTQAVEVHRPELLRYTRNWSYPVNTIDPTDGSPTSAMSWSVQERADKDRFFREPGFIVGVQVNRPKVYLGRPAGSITGYMQSALSWLPAILQNDGPSSYVTVPDNEGMGDIATSGWDIDVRDLFMYGEQFQNTGSTAGMNKLAGMPGGAFPAKRIPGATDALSVMLDTATANYVSSDGVVNLSIAGRLVDQSPAVVTP